MPATPVTTPGKGRVKQACIGLLSFQERFLNQSYRLSGAGKDTSMRGSETSDRNVTSYRASLTEFSKKQLKHAMEIPSPEIIVAITYFEKEFSDKTLEDLINNPGC